MPSPMSGKVGDEVGRMRCGVISPLFRNHSAQFYCITINWHIKCKNYFIRYVQLKLAVVGIGSAKNTAATNALVGQKLGFIKFIFCNIA